MRRYLSLLPLALLITPLASAQVVIELSQDGVVVERKVLPGDKTVMTDPPSPLLSPPARNAKGGGGVTPNTTWIIPRYSIDDSTANGDSTFISMRHLSNNLLNINVTLEYFNAAGVLVDEQDIEVTPHQTVSLNLRNNPLLVNPGGVATGVIAVNADNELAVDYFQVDFSDNFASGSIAPRLTEFCGFWTYRFVSFGGDSGSQIGFTLNAPIGPEPADPSVTGEVYNEAGVLINSFTIHTGNFLFDVPALDLVVGNASFGSMEILINTLGPTDFPGFVVVRHSAFGRFSVGLDAVCTPAEIS